MGKCGPKCRKQKFGFLPFPSTIMRAVIQRVASASVAGNLLFEKNFLCSDSLSTCPVDGETISKISKGLMVLVGIGSGRTSEDAASRLRML